MIEIITKENDDKNFISLVNQILNVGVNLTEPDEVFIIKVDHWFDHKWLSFSHKVLGELGIWNKELRIPPFIPDRVIEESHFQKEIDGYKVKSASILHIYQPSEDNTFRKIKLFSDSAIFLWYSGKTSINSQGSVMIYFTSKEFQNNWYVSFLNKNSWQIYKTKNTSKNEVKAMIESDYLALIR